MPQNERLRVWRGDLRKTSGGLTKDMLIKNKRGKIVSRKKSGQATSNENNLGSWLRAKGDKFEGEPKGLKEEEAPKKAAAPAKKKAAPPAKKKAAAPPAKKVKPKLTKVEPMKPGEKEELHKISVGNIKKKLTLWEQDYKYMKRKEKMSHADIIKELGPVPKGTDVSKL
mgnify:CR=1 FL=1